MLYLARTPQGVAQPFFTMIHEREYPFYLILETKRRSFIFPIILFVTTQIIVFLLPQATSPTNVAHRMALPIAVQRAIVGV